MMLRKYEYLLIGGGAAIFKAAMQLDRPVCAGVKTETYWNNRTTPLPPDVHLLLREESGHLSQWQLHQAPYPALNLTLGADISADALQQAEEQGLPALQPATSSGLTPDTRLQAYEELYCQEQIEFVFQQGVVYFALNNDKEWVFIGSEPQGVHLTIVSRDAALPTRLLKALSAAAALPTIAPAHHAQQLTRMQPWWWGGDRLLNYPQEDQIPEMVELEIESKLAVEGDFSAASWQLSDCLRWGKIPGFTPYPNNLLVRHTHDVICYLKGQHKLILQGAAYRFGQKSLKFAQSLSNRQTQSHCPIEVMIRNEIKPIYSPVVNLVTANDIQTRMQKLKPVGGLYCHKRKFLLQSAVTGGGYHVLIDYSRALAKPEESLAQIEVECQWKKMPPRQIYADPVCVAVEEIQQITQAVCNNLRGVAPTQLTKRKWLKQVLASA